MSEIKVNKISPVSDSGTIVNSGTATGFGGGNLGGVWHAVKTDTFADSTSQTWVDITGLSVTTGTLASSSSKILINVGLYGTCAHYETWKVVDGSGNDITNFIGDTAGSRIRCGGTNFYVADSTDWRNYTIVGSNGMMLDSPGVTTAQTYKVQCYGYNTTTFNLNREYSDGDGVATFRTVSSITAMEILA